MSRERTSRLRAWIAAVAVLAWPAAGAGLRAAEYHVAPDGDDGNDGTVERPLATPAPLAGRLKPGDVVTFRGGRYPPGRGFTLHGLRGTADRPITFRAHPGEVPCFDGTIRIAGDWQRHAPGIYRIRVPRPVWQLFLGRRVMSEARWPTMRYHDGYAEGTIWDRAGRYAQAAAPGTTPTRTVDMGLPDRRLKDVASSFAGGFVIANNASWHTNAMKITAHRPGDGFLDHEETAGADQARAAGRIRKGEGAHAKAAQRLRKAKPKEGDPGAPATAPPVGLWHYFVTNHLACLDAPQEWSFDEKENVLYFCPPDRRDPTGGDVRGKVLSYAVVVRDCEHVDLDGLSFFACTFAVVGSSRCRVRNGDLLFASTVTAELGINRAHPTILSTDPRAYRDLPAGNAPLGTGAEKTPTVTPAGGAAGPIDAPGGNVLFNCAFRGGTQGPGLVVSGPGARVENCLFENLDWYLAASAGFGLTMSSPGGMFRRNTVRTSGCSEGIKIGPPQIVELNRIRDCGHLQDDGGQFQTSPGGQHGVIYRHNWSHDTSKYAIRFDGDVTKGMKPGVRPEDVAKGGKYGNLVANVAWNTNRTIYVKGNHHRVVHNTSFNHAMADLVIRGFKDKTGYENSRTVTRNNCTTHLAASRTELKPVKYPVPGQVSHNQAGTDLRAFLRDPDNLDFRPKAGSPLVDAAGPLGDVDFRLPGAAEATADIGQLLLFPAIGKGRDIGAYEHGAPYYWIPGRRLPKASTPVPPDGAGGVKRDADLMWLEGLDATGHDVYFGEDRGAVERADRSAPVFVKRLPVASNVVAPPAQLAEGVTYFWRVDAVQADGSAVRGDVWRFRCDGNPFVRKRWPRRDGIRESDLED